VQYVQAKSITKSLSEMVLWKSILSKMYKKVKVVEKSETKNKCSNPPSMSPAKHVHVH
jgi:hypothetical protein